MVFENKDCLTDIYVSTSESDLLGNKTISQLELWSRPFQEICCAVNITEEDLKKRKNAWQSAMWKHDNRSTKSQSTRMDSLKPSDESMVRGRSNPNESSVNHSRAPKENFGGSENSKHKDRKQCLVIKGLHESTAVRPEDRVAEDLASFNGLLNQLLPPGVEVKLLKNSGSAKSQKTVYERHDRDLSK
ncbi:unnamed protein product [Schistocephalus solidus]|uniref:Rab3 GTPase-activating protein catalytic subunit n=1 Tax=Schistocephalus solidus TaxID=70667 RepID=A0A183TSX4_SCHSO|nr:unnamed protein product [Schistocephalus solidus]